VDAVLYGRVEELALVDQFLDAVRMGAIALSILGVPGSGKTTLWRAAVDRASQRSWTVLAL